MNRILLVTAISLVALTGFTVNTADSFLTSGQILGDSEYDQTTLEIVEEPTPALDESAQFKQIAAVLNQTATGKHILNMKEVTMVIIQFEAGRGSRYQQHTNLILLDSNHSPVKAALFFAHEMHHAQTMYEGNKANIKSESRHTYINHKLQEEVQGMMVSIQVKMELERMRVDVSDVTLPLETTYRSAYLVASDQALVSDNALSEQQLEAIGRAAGEQALYDAFASGEIKTSNSFEPYKDYYGNAWDDAHPIKALVAGLLGG